MAKFLTRFSKSGFLVALAASFFEDEPGNGAGRFDERTCFFLVMA